MPIRKCLCATTLIMAVCMMPAYLHGQEDETLAPPDPAIPVLPPTIVTGTPESGGRGEGTGPAGPARFTNSPFDSPPANGYTANRATTGTKIDVPLIDVPASVETITRQVMDDQEAVTFYDLMRNVSGVYRYDGGAGGTNDKLMMRGLEVEGNKGIDFRKNGFRNSCRTQRETANVERIEVLKGPASVLYGAIGQPSGIINYVTKQPLASLHHQADIRFGYFDDYRFTADSTGPLTCSGNSAYRLNVAAQDAGSFRDFVDMDRVFIAPVVEWRIDGDTSLSVEMDWLHDRRVGDRGIPYYNGSFQAVPISRFLGEPDSWVRTETGLVGIHLNRRLGPYWAFRAGYVSNWAEESRYVVEQKKYVAPGSSEVVRRMKDQELTDGDHFFIGDLMGEFATGCWQHRIVLGTELGTKIRQRTTLEGNGTNIDIFNPVYGLPQPAPNRLRNEYDQNNQYGLYFQDLIEMSPYLKGVAGVRWDSFRRRTFETLLGPGPVDSSDTALSPRFGLVLQPVPEIFSIYTSYSESFAPQTGVTRLGVPYAPETGRMYEVGLKFVLLEERLLLNFAGFDIFHEGILVDDPIDDSFSIQAGEAESKGVEFDLYGQLTARWGLLANCAYIDSRITDDSDVDRVGNRLPNVPYFGASVWTRYDLIQTPCRTFGLSTGMVYLGERQANIDNKLQVPGYARWDAGLYYRKGRLNVSLLAENLLDTFYIAAGKSDVANVPGAPFNMKGTVQVVY